ncbi:MAG: short-chain dehydrogenase [Rhodospirillaceae bacterium]|nr:short-chain dehydrogenase [Rhodospirillaceae bacterium]
MSEIDFSGKGVLITGGASGIGRASADVFAARGAAVAVSDIDKDKTRAVARELGNQHVAAPGDVADETSVVELVATAKAGLGTIDVLINCAGVSDSFAPTLDQTVGHWQRIIDINLTGTYLTCRAVAPDMLDRREGSIVNISSIAGLFGLPYRNAYVASKHGVAGVTKNLAAEWGQRGVRVNAVAPGYIKTPMVQNLIDAGRVDETRIRRRTPMGRLGTPEDVANLMMYLSSPLAAYVNGVVIPVDGGWSSYGAAGDAAEVD